MYLRLIGAVLIGFLLAMSVGFLVNLSSTDKPSPQANTESVAEGNSPAIQLPDFTSLVNANKPAVVNISTTRKLSSIHPFLPKDFEFDRDNDSAWQDLLRRFFGGGDPERQPEHDAQSSGSGFIISTDGYVITNHHVVNNADEVIVRLDDRRELTASVIGSDPRSDVALLKIDADNLPVVNLGSSESLRVGEWVLAIGSPFGFDHSVTAGIVSAKGRSLPNENYVPFIQTDVAINPGNSGGPLFDLKGRVVGVNSQIYSRTGGFMGLSFAIPIELVLEVVEQLKNGGQVSRGWLGVLIQEVTRDLAESFKLEKPTGALVTRVFPDSPAEVAGIMPGDIILEFNGKPVIRSAALPPMVGRVKAGENARVVILRDGELITLSVDIAELPAREQIAQQHTPLKPDTDKSGRLGLTLKDPDDRIREEYNLSSGGVEVIAVEPGPAATAGIRPGDVITLMNNEPVTDVKEFLEKIDSLDTESPVALLVQRPSGPKYLAMRLP